MKSFNVISAAFTPLAFEERLYFILQGLGSIEHLSNFLNITSSPGDLRGTKSPIQLLHKYSDRRRLAKYKEVLHTAIKAQVGFVL